MLNRAVLVGRLTKDPDLRYTQSGIAVANFTVAVNRPFSNQQGTREADFINCVVWRKQAENFANYMRKGNQVGVDGRIQTRTFETKDGKTAFVTEVVADSVQFLEPKNARQNSGSEGMSRENPNQHQGGNTQEDPFKDDGEPIDISDDDLPF